MTPAAAFQSIASDPTAASVVLLVTVFVVAGCLERPRAPLSSGPQGARWILNIALAVLNYGLIAYAVQALFVPVAEMREALALPRWPDGLGGTLAAFVVLDLMRYGLHRLFHAQPFLWRLHRVHHSDVDVDVSTSFRHHPVEFAALSIIVAAANAVFAVPLAATVAYVLVANVLSVIGHANLQLPAWLGRRLARAVLTPDFHGLHHAADPRFHHGNYGAVLTIWDQLFGTYREPATWPVKDIAFGITSAPEPGSAAQ
jgi:sterol desaturase/sphingolipid hydroxylase (fatty acid hydroxylase superfamily)